MKLTNNKKTLTIILPLIAVIGIFLFGHSALAAWDWVISIVAGFLGIFIMMLGVILVIVIKGLILIASYQNFIGSPAVTLGWVIVRDICNMFFVIVLLIIAFGTILHLEEYSYKKWLPKLILMAVLINFSKTICGLMIDAAQIVMLTFVNAFKDVGGANLTEILGLSDIVTLAKTEGTGATMWTVVGAYGLGFIYLLIAIVTIVTMMMMLVMRLVMIWLYVVLSPLAYLLSAFPGGQKYASQWWSEFTKNLIVGPVLAFFIWLSFAALQTYSQSNFDSEVTKTNESATAEISKLGNIDANTTGTDALAASKASTPGFLIQYVIAIGMLLGGLKISQEIGGAAGSMAGKGMAAIQKGQGWAMAGGAGLAGVMGTIAKQPFSWSADKIHQKTGVDLNLKRAWGVAQAKRKENKEKRYGEGVIAAREAMESGGRVHGILAMTGNAGDAWEQMTSLKGVGKRLKGGKMMQRLKGEGIQEERQAKNDKARYEFEEKWADADDPKRTEMVKKTEDERDAISKEIKDKRIKISSINKELETENKKNPLLQDKGKIENLEKEKAQHSARINDLRQRGEELQPVKQFISDVQRKGEERKVYTSAEKDNIKIAQNKAGIQATEAQKKVERNIPEYAFEARATEQKLVSQEAAKIKDISDPTELLRILQDAIKSHDRTMVKAITLKMTKDYNDNEFTQPLVGDTTHIGLKDLMRQFSTKGSKNYAGFGEQEAFSLGSQIAELNKVTNHWAATSAYKMENGRWRETTDKEHHEIRDIETGKMQLEGFIRNSNRLAYGGHDAAGKFYIDAGGVIKLRAMNNKDGHKRMETMPESAALNIYQAITEDKLSKLYKEFTTGAPEDGISIVDRLEQRLGVLKSEGTFDNKYDNATETLS
ncbi:MAG: hypothetical protein Q8N57_03955 [bacterium]|nr:hypothetical protein [bacterium]